MNHFSIFLKQAALLCFLLLFYTSQAQNADLPNEPLGSAKNLQGKNLIVNCFISELGKEWTLEEKKNILSKEHDGFKWIKLESKSWNVAEPSFEIINIGLEKDISLSKIEAGKKAIEAKVSWVPLVVYKAGYPSITDLYDSLKKATGADNIAMLIYAKQKGRSFAKPSGSDNIHNGRFLEGAVIYERSTNDSLLQTGTIIHELLHLYGAWDMYHEGKKRSSKKHQNIQRILARSIMVQNHQQMDILVVEAVTAWRIGWTKRYWGWYDIFRPEPVKPN